MVFSILTSDVIGFLNYMLDTKEFNEILNNFENDYKGTQHIKFKESIKRDIRDLVKEITVNGGHI